MAKKKTKLKYVLYKVIRKDTHKVLYVDGDILTAIAEFHGLSKRFRSMALLIDGKPTIIDDNACLTDLPKLSLIKVTTEVIS